MDSNLIISQTGKRFDTIPWRHFPSTEGPLVLDVRPKSIDKTRTLKGVLMVKPSQLHHTNFNADTVQIPFEIPVQELTSGKKSKRKRVMTPKAGEYGKKYSYDDIKQHEEYYKRIEANEKSLSSLQYGYPIKVYVELDKEKSTPGIEAFIRLPDKQKMPEFIRPGQEVIFEAKGMTFFEIFGNSRTIVAFCDVILCAFILFVRKWYRKRSNCCNAIDRGRN